MVTMLGPRHATSMPGVVLSLVGIQLLRRFEPGCDLRFSITQPQPQIYITAVHANETNILLLHDASTDVLRSGLPEVVFRFSCFGLEISSRKC